MVKIRVFKFNDRWQADPVDLPGYPPTAWGDSPAEAVGRLMFDIREEIPTFKGYGWPSISIIDKNGNEMPNWGEG